MSNLPQSSGISATSMAMEPLVQLLLRLLQDDESAAQAVLDARPEAGFSDSAWAVSSLRPPLHEFVMRNGPLRVMNEVAAKRALVDLCVRRIRDGEGEDGATPRSVALKVDALSAKQTLRILASAYPEARGGGLSHE